MNALRLIWYVFIFSAGLIFIGLNSGQRVDINLAATVIKDVPAGVACAAAFLLGLIACFPLLASAYFRSLKRLDKERKKAAAALDEQKAKCKETKQQEKEAAKREKEAAKNH